MAPPPPKDEIAIYRAGITTVIAEAAAAERELVEVYAQSAKRLRELLRAEADNMNALQLREVVKVEFERTRFQRRKVIATIIESGAAQGPKTARETFRKVFGEDVTRAQVRGTKAALEEGAERIAGKVTVDKVSLSKRIRRWDAELGEQMAQAVERGIKAKNGIIQIAKRIEKLDDVTEGLPKYLQEVEALARKGQLPELKALSKRYIARAKKLLGETQVGGAKAASAYSLRSPTQKFLRDVQKAGADGIDGVVNTYVKERAAWRARVIARQESVEAMRSSYKAQLKGKRGVVCIQHKLSGRHPKADICDYWANANLYELGPGRYPVGKEPRLHVGCLCYHVAVMDERTFERDESAGVPDEFVDRKSPDGIGWLRENPDRAAAILGPTRFEAMQRGFSVLDDGQQLVPVGELLGRMSHAAE
jgi:hypothetical protein